MRALAIIVAFAIPGLACAQPATFNERQILAAKTEAAQAQPACIAELERGAESEACEAYRTKVLNLIGAYNLRDDWCIAVLKASSKRGPEICYSGDGVEAAFNEIGYSQFEALSRRVHPANWARADAAVAALPR